MARNVVIIHTDEHLFTQLGCMGNDQIRTPNIDALAAEGTLFSNAYTCNGVCVPSRASLLTGRYPIATGVASNEPALPPSEKLMGRYFADAGYATGYFGKTHYGRPDGEMQAHGWGESFIWHKQYNEYLRQQGIDARYPEGKEIRRPDVRYWDVGASRIPCEHYFEKVITDKAMDFVRSRRSEPFLCFVAHVAPHGPFTPPKPYDTLYSPDDMQLWPPHESELQDRPPQFVRWVEQNRKYVSEQELKVYLAHVYALVTLVDDQVGRIAAALKEAGVYDETLIVFTADHGDFSTKYGFFGKSWCMDDCLMRVPLVISHPEHRRANRNECLTENVDILPTVLDFAGIESNSMVQGTSLLPVLTGEKEKVKDEVFGYNHFQYSRDGIQMSMIRRGRFKLVQSGDFTELYDMQDDPDETENLAGRPERQDLVVELRERLLRWHVTNSSGFFDVGNAGFWEDRTNFYDESRFSP